MTKKLKTYVVIDVDTEEVVLTDASSAEEAIESCGEFYLEGESEFIVIEVDLHKPTHKLGFKAVRIE